MTETKQKGMPLSVKVLCVVLASLIVLAGLVLLGARAYFRLPAGEYYKASEKGFEIPGLGDNFVPQGMDYDDRSACFFVTGYMSDGAASPVYLIKHPGGEPDKTVHLATKDGKDFDGHAGGLTVHGDYVYIAGGSDYCLYVYSYAEILQAADGAKIHCLGEFSTGRKEDGIRVSFTASDEVHIYVGEFYREGNYSTPESHKLTTAAGDYQQAFAVAYAFSDGEDAVFGIAPTPVVAYSLPDCVQGMCFQDRKIYLSTSYGTSFSYIYEYNKEDAVKQKDITLMGTELSLYALDSDALEEEYKLPPMAEEIEFVDGKLYTMCESASNKYIFGKLTSSKWCYATDLDKMD
ncbi:MAG: hypothetical protein IJX94_04155 [Clostridia bacterium]|nr:hypothetical protein [Clostridia bacterium]